MATPETAAAGTRERGAGAGTATLILKSGAPTAGVVPTASVAPHLPRGPARRHAGAVQAEPTGSTSGDSAPARAVALVIRLRWWRRHSTS